MDAMEKISLMRIVKTGIDKLKAGIADISERLKTMREVKENLAKLKEEAAPQKSLLDRFLAGEFMKATYLEMRGILNQIIPLVNGDIGILKDAFRQFIEWHEAQGKGAKGVMESAILPVVYDGDQMFRQLEAFLRSGRKGTVTIRMG